jgi:hypothetical protein
MAASKSLNSLLETAASSHQDRASTHLLDLQASLLSPSRPTAPAALPPADNLTGIATSRAGFSVRALSPALSQSAGPDGITGLALPAAPTTPALNTASGNTSGTEQRQLYIVFLDGDTLEDRPGLAKRVQQLLGADPSEDLLEHLNGFTARLTAAQALQLQRSQGVRNIEADSLVTLVAPVSETKMQATGTISTAGQTTPYGVPMVWGATDYSNTDNSRKYAFVLDTGVSTQTNDLTINTTYSRNFTSRKSSDWIDYQGHGTHVAGTIAAINDGDGVIGVAAGTNIVSIRVLDRNGSGQTSWIVNGINYIAGLVKSGALSTINVTDLVANMSLGGGLNSTLDNAVRAAATPTGGRYLRFAIAAGNSGADVDNSSPANTGDAANIYTVSAVDGTKTMASWSNYDNLGDSIDDCDFSAPGVGIVSLGMSAGSLISMSGTSMAAPHVAGALLMGTPLAGPISSPVISGASGDPLAYLA